ncbi:ABC transporter permease [Microbispora sp. H10670]|uniref:ABC transporter permease n=1 Tax=Microbispora sp. H10670 TaxID=2729108 RepID=UPI001601BA53|nr:ABC transporter permease [Microbispora sp. H10670]
MAGVLKTSPAGAAAARTEDRRSGRGHGSLVRLVLVRLAASAGVLWGAVTVTFVLLQVMPGSTADVLLARTSVSPEVRERIVAEYGLDDPIPVQYLTYLGRIVRGEFGESYVLRRPVWGEIAAQLPSTLLLVATTLLATIVASVALGVVSANRRAWVRSLFASAESLVVALPPFWLGLLLLTVFSFTLHWFPAIGSSSPAGLVLPTAALAAGPTAVVAGVLREGLLRAADEPFVVTARARGLGETALRLRHVLRHALVPVTTLLGWIAGSLIGGAVIIEIVFSRQGIGRLALSAVANKDMPVVVAVVLVTAIAFVLVTIAVDILTWVIDPRTRDSGR